MRIHAVLLSAIVVCACSENQVNGNALVDASVPDSLAEQLSDAQVMGVVLALNQGEIDQGKVAQANAVAPEVKAYGDKMVTEHQAALDRENALGIPSAESPLRTQVQTESQSLVTLLQDKSGDSFDLAYVEAQITVHTKALDTVDTTLIPANDNALLAAELTTLRASIQAHLTEARALRTMMVPDIGVTDATAEATTP